VIRLVPRSMKYESSWLRFSTPLGASAEVRVGSPSAQLVAAWEGHRQCNADGFARWAFVHRGLLPSCAYGLVAEMGAATDNLALFEDVVLAYRQALQYVRRLELHVAPDQAHPNIYKVMSILAEIDRLENAQLAQVDADAGSGDFIAVARYLVESPRLQRTVASRWLRSPKHHRAVTATLAGSLISQERKDER
jgi:hypothetical protein